jgi:uncharacterized protein (TIGR02246 family)
MAHGMTDRTLRELSDLEAIRDLARRYAHCVWQRDVAGCAALFIEDGEMDPGLGQQTIVGREAMVKAYTPMVERGDLQPFVHNHVIDLDGDEASGTVYLDLKATMDGKAMIGSGFYEDRYVRTAEGWRFASRKLTFRHFVPFTEGWAPSKT